MSSKPRSRGFTLLEVLVALAIVGLGMIAVFSQLNQSLLATERLRQRTLAHWVAVDRITELRVAGEFPEVSERSDDIEMARTEWSYTVKISQTPVENFRRVDVLVSFADSPDNVIAQVTGFVARPPDTETVRGTLFPLPNDEGQFTEGETE